ncbi:MAG: very short patch repair endonuclease [Muribaculaceae bacterium]|nr:very short patch repair endonuclease [Muribaculaceae bacterium]
MTDRLSTAQRHRCMSHIRSRNTKPEIKVRQWLWQHGYRYRLCVKGVPGKPDIVMRKYRTAIFVNGCFWHGHDIKWKTENGKLKGGDALRASDTENGEWRIESSKCCKIPQSNREFWVNKIRRNQERDQQNYQVLQENGWQVLVIWECQLKASVIEHTMRQVEVSLQDYYLKTLNRKAVAYIHVEEADLPIAAEESLEYN